MRGYHVVIATKICENRPARQPQGSAVKNNAKRKCYRKTRKDRWLIKETFSPCPNYFS